jgi:MFS transporter, FSR family, fosmidomycin resistance protein
MSAARKEMSSIWIALAITWIAHFLVDVMIGFWSVYKTIAGVDLALAGLIAGVCAFIGEGMQILFGNLGDKGHRKALLIFGIGATSANALLPFSDHVFFFFLFFLLTSIGSGAFHPTAVAMTSSLTQHRKGLFITLFASGGALGLAFSHLIFSTWYLHFKLSTAWLMLPSFALLLFILTQKLPGALPVPSKPGHRFGFSAMKKLFECRELKLLYFSQICVQSIYWGTIFLLPDILVSKGYPVWMCFGAGHFTFIIGGALMLVPGGLLSDKYSARNVLFVSKSLGCVIFYLFLLSPQLSNTATLLLLLGLGASVGIANPVAVSLGNRIMPSRPGLVSAFLMGMVWCIAEWVGPGGGGLLTKCFSENAPTMAMAILGVFFVIGTILVSMLPYSVEKEFELEAA